MKNTTNLLLLLLLTCVLLLFSCKDNTPAAQLLAQAQNTVESKPKDALGLLDSIQNPEKMDKEKYMEYIVSHTQARFKTKADVTNDTLVFEAQMYFNKKNDPLKKALANFYAGVVYRQKGMTEAALKSFLEANESSKKINNYLLTARAEHNIGNIYFERDVMDTAIVRYKEALAYYNKEKNTETYKLQVISQIGRSYGDINKLDSALFYSKQGLELAAQTANKGYQATFTHQLGIFYRETKDYKKASDYLHKALLQSEDTGESLRIYLSLSRLHVNLHQSDSAKYYSNLIKDRLSEVKDNYILRSMYGALSDFNNQQGNYQEALRYKDLQAKADLKISQANNSQTLLEVENQYKLWLKEKEISELKTRSHLYIVVAILIILSILFVVYLKKKNARHKQEQEEESKKLLETQNKLLLTQNELLNQRVESLSFLQSIYQDIINDWTTIDKEILKLAQEYGAKEKPAIFVRIEDIFKSLKSKGNLQLIERGKEWFRQQPYGGKALELLSERDILLFLLHQHGYTLKEISTIIGVTPGKDKMFIRKLGIRNKLLDAQMPKDEIYAILFPNGEE